MFYFQVVLNPVTISLLPPSLDGWKAKAPCSLLCRKVNDHCPSLIIIRRWPLVTGYILPARLGCFITVIVITVPKRHPINTILHTLHPLSREKVDFSIADHWSICGVNLTLYLYLSLKYILYCSHHIAISSGAYSSKAIIHHTGTHICDSPGTRIAVGPFATLHAPTDCIHILWGVFFSWMRNSGGKAGNRIHPWYQPTTAGIRSY